MLPANEFEHFTLQKGTTKMTDLKNIIDEAFEQRSSISPLNVATHVKQAVTDCIDALDSGQQRVAEKIDGTWVVHEWLKKAVLLSFRIQDNRLLKGGFTNYFDKVEPKFADYNSRAFRETGVRVVPPATVRRGSFVAGDVVLMPSYVNIGAYVDSVTMVDTWANLALALK